MKSSLAITLGIIAVAGFASWRNQQEIARATHAYGLVLEEASALGIQADSGGQLQRTRSRTNRQPHEKVSAADLIAFTTELQNQSDTSDIGLMDERERRTLEWQRRLLALDRTAMEQLIAEIDATAGLRKDTRREVLFLVMQTLAESHPDAALDLIAGSPEMLDHPEARARIASGALARGMATDPEAGTAWLKQHLDLFPAPLGRLVTERAMLGISPDNPKAAFGLIGSIGTLDAEYAVRKITLSARSIAQRDVTLGVFREYLTSVEDPALREKLHKEGTFAMISTSLNDGVDGAIEKLGGGRFTPEEITAYASVAGFDHDKLDTAKWIGWLQQNVPAETISSRIIPELVSSWIHSDYRAVGEWLGKTEGGPVKDAATFQYASAIAGRFPSSAAEWALTLPPGKERETLLPMVYKRWLEKDPTAAAAFAERNGIAK